MRDRIRERLGILGLTQKDLADKMSFSAMAIGHYVNGRRTPRHKHLLELAKELECDPGWLLCGPTETEGTGSSTHQNTALSKIPLLSNNEIKSYLTSKKLAKNADFLAAFGYEPIPNQNNKKENTAKDVNKNLFAMRVQTDAMIFPSHPKSFRENEILIIDSKRDPKPNDFVIVQLAKKKEIALRQYVIESGTPYLKPLNPQYPIIPLSKNIEILGVVATVMRSLVSEK